MKKYRKDVVIKVRDTESFVKRTEAAANEMQMNKTDFLRMIMHTGVSYYEKRLKELRNENKPILEDASSKIKQESVDMDEMMELAKQMEKFK